MAVQMTKSQLIEKISGETEVAKKDVKGVLETLATVGYKELKKSGVFLVPGIRQIRRDQEAGHQGAAGHQSVHRRGDDVQGQAGPKNRQGSPGQGGKRRGIGVERPPAGPFGILGGCPVGNGLAAVFGRSSSRSSGAAGRRRLGGFPPRQRPARSRPQGTNRPVQRHGVRLQFGQHRRRAGRSTAIFVLASPGSLA